jgi:Flp pilus assembly protein TadD
VLGRILLNRDDVEGAIKNLEEGARLAPLSREMHFELARAYARAGRKDDAARERETFRKLDEATQATRNPDQSLGGADPASKEKPPE